MISALFVVVFPVGWGRLVEKWLLKLCLFGGLVIGLGSGRVVLVIP